MSYNKYPKEMKDNIISRLVSGEETVTDIQRDGQKRQEIGHIKRKNS